MNAQNFSAFLAQNALKETTKKIIVSDRFKDADGNPMEWEFKSISAGEDSAIRKSCMRQIPVPGRKGQFMTSVDSEEYQKELICKSCVFPPLDNAELQESYKVYGAHELLDAMLTAGEYLNLVQEFTNLFTVTRTSMDDKVEEAKN